MFLISYGKLMHMSKDHCSKLLLMDRKTNTVLVQFISCNESKSLSDATSAWKQDTNIDRGEHVTTSYRFPTGNATRKLLPQPALNRKDAHVWCDLPQGELARLVTEVYGTGDIYSVTSLKRLASYAHVPLEDDRI